jgi:hypothetical protein
MIEIIETPYGTAWKLRRRSWIRKGEEIKLQFTKTSEMI